MRLHRTLGFAEGLRPALGILGGGVGGADATMQSPVDARFFGIILPSYMDVSENSGTPKSSILLGFSIINHPFWGTPIFGTPHMNQSVERNISLKVLRVHDGEKWSQKGWIFLL